MSKQFSDFADDLMPWLPGATQTTVAIQWKKVVIEYLERTFLWTHELSAQSITGGIFKYGWLAGVDLPAETRIVRIDDVWLDGIPLPPANETDLRREYNEQWSVEVDDPPRWYLGLPDYPTQDPNGELVLRIVPIPSQGGGVLTGQVTLTYNRLFAGNIEDWLFQRHYNPIIAGTFKNMFSMLKKPWSNAALYTENFQAYEAAIGERNIEREGLQYARKPLRSTPVFR